MERRPKRPSPITSPIARLPDNKDDQAECDGTEDAEDYGSQANGNKKQ